MLLATAVPLAACGRPEPAPDLAYTLLDGSRSSTAALRGRVVLVNFWATSCAVCVREMPQIVATHERFASRGLQTLAVAMQYDAPAAVAAFAERRRLPFGVVIDNTGTLAQGLGPVRGTPTLLLIDRRGRVAERIVGAPDFAALHDRIEALLAEA